MKKYKILITGGGGVTGRSVARSLRKSEIFGDSCLIACDIFQNKFAIFEGLYHTYYKLPHVEHPDYFEKFLTLVRKEQPDAVLIMTDKEMLFWSDQEQQFPCLISPLEFNKVAADKYLLHKCLQYSKLVPKFTVFSKGLDQVEIILRDEFYNAPVWVRGFDFGSTSGKGACLIHNAEEAMAWFEVNQNIREFMIADYLPGRNFACNVLFYKGKFLQHAMYERLEYFMPHITPSGITGNISVGKLINDEDVLNNSLEAIRVIEKETHTVAHGLYTVDLKGSAQGVPLITEINLRHTAATYAFAQGGLNMAEYQCLATMEQLNMIPEETKIFPQGNVLLRDIDGEAVYVDDINLELKRRLNDLTQ